MSRQQGDKRKGRKGLNQEVSSHIALPPMEVAPTGLAFLQVWRRISRRAVVAIAVHWKCSFFLDRFLAAAVMGAAAAETTMGVAALRAAAARGDNGGGS